MIQKVLHPLVAGAGGGTRWALGALMFTYSTKDHLSDGVKANVLPVVSGGAKLVGGGMVGWPWPQNPVLMPITGNVLLPQPAAQGVLLYGVGAKVPAVVEGVNNAQGAR